MLETLTELSLEKTKTARGSQSDGSLHVNIMHTEAPNASSYFHINTFLFEKVYSL